MKPRSALVIGGGIAGPAVAMALQRAGIEPIIYEAYDAPAEHVGSFLNVASNGMDVLATLGIGGHVAQAGLSSKRMVMWSGTGKRLGDVANGVVLRDGTTSTTIQRGRLHQLMHDALVDRGITVVTGKRLIHATSHDDAAVAGFEDGTSVASDLIIGADGVHSQLRTIIDAGAPAPRYSGLLSIGGTARNVDLPANPDTFNMIFGRRAFFSYTVRRDGEVWWFANLPREQEPVRGELASIPSAVWHEQLKALFADDRAPALDILTHSDHELGAYALHDLPNVPIWHRGRLVLVGDAAHATSPSAGQGASMAIESALVLTRALRDLDHHTAAFAIYEFIRRPRVERIVRYSARVSGTKSAGPVGRWFRDLTMPLALRLFANPESHAWMYRHHIPWDDPITRDLAREAA